MGEFKVFLQNLLHRKKVKAIKFREYKRNRHKLFSLLFDKKEEIRPVTKRLDVKVFMFALKYHAKNFQ